MKRNLNARMVPLISVFAAFSFVVMLFNLPLPGGTTGHALGVTIAAIVLGPSGAILATSLAIAIQALFFGDGGITTLGANCFNMAVVGSLVAYVDLSRDLCKCAAGLSSRRRVWPQPSRDISRSTRRLCLTAVEFGIQPMLFRDAQGVPLYAPYSLRRRRSSHDDWPLGDRRCCRGSDFRWSRRLSSGCRSRRCLRATSGLVDDADSVQLSPPRSLRRLWITVALLMLLTPLGILAAGTAWGEWSASRFCYCRGPRRNRKLVEQSAALPTRRPPGSAATLHRVDRADSGLRATICQKRSLRIPSVRCVWRWTVDATFRPRVQALFATWASRRFPRMSQHRSGSHQHLASLTRAMSRAHGFRELSPASLDCCSHSTRGFVWRDCWCSSSQ